MSFPLDFSQLKLTSATIEIRYDKAYILWDRAGKIWSKANLTWFGLKSRQAEPNVTRFIINDRFDAMVSLDRSHLIDTKPTSSLKDFIEYAPIFLDLVMDSLEINKIERIGFRLIFKKFFKDKETAANAILSSKMMAVPTGKYFNIQGKVLSPNYSLVWEGESTAARVSLKAVEEKIDFNPPAGLEDEIPSVHLTKHEVLYDIDYYTINAVLRGQFNVKDWIEQAHLLIKRDSKHIIGLSNVS